MARPPSVKDLAIALSDPQIRKMIIYPRQQHRKKPSLPRDWMSAAIVSTLSDGNFEQTFDNDESIDKQNGRPLLEWYPRGSAIVLVGGPLSHDVVNYYMNRAVGHKEQAPVQYVLYQHRNRMKFQQKQEVLVDVAVAEISKGEVDYGVVQAFEDGEKRRILMVSGFAWQGTWAASLWFRYKALKDGLSAATVVKWTDRNQNGLVELDEVQKIRSL
jgi:hypothetical protein